MDTSSSTLTDNVHGRLDQRLRRFGSGGLVTMRPASSSLPPAADETAGLSGAKLPLCAASADAEAGLAGLVERARLP